MSSQAYFSPDFYDCVEAASAGQSPSTNPEKWQAVWIPRDFQECLTAHAAATLLTGQKQFEMATDQANKANTELARLVNESARRYGNPRQLRVVDRGI